MLPSIHACAGGIFANVHVVSLLVKPYGSLLVGRSARPAGNQLVLNPLRKSREHASRRRFRAWPRNRSSRRRARAAGRRTLQLGRWLNGACHGRGPVPVESFPEPIIPAAAAFLQHRQAKAVGIRSEQSTADLHQSRISPGRSRNWIFRCLASSFPVFGSCTPWRPGDLAMMEHDSHPRPRFRHPARGRGPERPWPDDRLPARGLTSDAGPMAMHVTIASWSQKTMSSGSSSACRCTPAAARGSLPFRRPRVRRVAGRHHGAAGRLFRRTVHHGRGRASAARRRPDAPEAQGPSRQAGRPDHAPELPRRRLPRDRGCSPPRWLIPTRSIRDHPHHRLRLPGRAAGRAAPPARRACLRHRPLARPGRRDRRPGHRAGHRRRARARLACAGCRRPSASSTASGSTAPPGRDADRLCRRPAERPRSACRAR